MINYFESDTRLKVFGRLQETFIFILHNFI